MLRPSAQDTLFTRANYLIRVRRWVIIGASISTAALCGSCAPDIFVVQPPPLEADRSAFGNVAVVLVDTSIHSIHPQPDDPPTGAGASTQGSPEALWIESQASGDILITLKSATEAAIAQQDYTLVGKAPLRIVRCDEAPRFQLSELQAYKKQGIDTVLAIVATRSKVLTYGSGPDLRVRSWNQFEATLVRLDSETPLFRREFSYANFPVSWTTAVGLNPNPIREQQQARARLVIEQAFEAAFLQINVPLKRLTVPTSGGHLAYGLRPAANLQHPYPQASATESPGGTMLFPGVQLDTRTPTLAWEPFPTPEDLHGPQGQVLAAATGVTYELKVAMVAADGHAAPFVDAKELVNPQYRFDKPLGWLTTYQWAVRARFWLNGKPRVTGWSGICHPRRSDECVFLAPYRFTTSN